MPPSWFPGSSGCSGSSMNRPRAGLHRQLGRAPRRATRALEISAQPRRSRRPAHVQKPSPPYTPRQHLPPSAQTQLRHAPPRQTSTSEGHGEPKVSHPAGQGWTPVRYVKQGCAHAPWFGAQLVQNALSALAQNAPLPNKVVHWPSRLQPPQGPMMVPHRVLLSSVRRQKHVQLPLPQPHRASSAPPAQKFSPTSQVSLRLTHNRVSGL